jgi:hypothetical protein
MAFDLVVITVKNDPDWRSYACVCRVCGTQTCPAKTPEGAKGYSTLHTCRSSQPRTI